MHFVIFLFTLWNFVINKSAVCFLISFISYSLSVGSTQNYANVKYNISLYAYMQLLTFDFICIFTTALLFSAEQAFAIKVLLFFLSVDLRHSFLIIFQEFIYQWCWFTKNTTRHGLDILTFRINIFIKSLARPIENCGFFSV